MKHNIINTENYLLVVDDSEIKEGDYSFYWNAILKVQIGVNYSNPKAHQKVIAHLPLNNSPILEGVDILPPLEDDKAICPYPEEKQNAIDWHNGYNKAKEKYKYTEEDLRKAWNAAYIDALAIDEETYKPLFFEDFIQSLQQPKMPVGFECEMNLYMASSVVYKPQTTTNSQGHTEWVGKYVY